MKKIDELTDPSSCMNKASDDELTFVLLGRDAAAPAAIRAWIEERIRLDKNTRDDPQIIEAERCAAAMEAERVPKPRTVRDVANKIINEARETGVPGIPLEYD